MDQCFPKNGTACDPDEVAAETEREVNEMIDEIEDLVRSLSDADDVTLECDFGIVLSNPSGDIVSRSGETNLLGSSATNENTVSLVMGTVLTIGTWILMMDNDVT